MSGSYLSPAVGEENRVLPGDLVPVAGGVVAEVITALRVFHFVLEAERLRLEITRRFTRLLLSNYYCESRGSSYSLLLSTLVAARLVPSVECISLEPVLVASSVSTCGRIYFNLFLEFGNLCGKSNYQSRSSWIRMRTLADRRRSAVRARQRRRWEKEQIAEPETQMRLPRNSLSRSYEWIGAMGT